VPSSEKGNETGVLRIGTIFYGSGVNVQVHACISGTGYIHHFIVQGEHTGSAKTGDTMHISVIGTGYIGSVTGACLAEMGHSIVFVGRDIRKLDLIRAGTSPIFEPGLDTLLTKNRERIETTTDLVYAVGKTDLTFICVGTPPGKDGSSDLSQIRDVSHTIGKALKTHTRFKTIITKSTVLPGTIENVILPILEKESGKKAGSGFGIASNERFWHCIKPRISQGRNRGRRFFPYRPGCHWCQ